MSSAIPAFRRSSGTRSGIGVSHQSTSPLCNAAAAVAASGMTRHSTRSNATRLPPASQSPGSSRGRIAVELLEHRLRARHPLVALEAERAGADVFADLLERVGLGDALGHDEGAGRADFAQRVQHLAERLLEAEAEAAVVHRRDLVQPGADHLAHVVAHHPALQAGDAVGGADRLAVVPFEAGAELEIPGQAVGGDLAALAHLRLRAKLAVHAIERVEEQHAGVAHHVERGPDRVEIGQVGLRDEPQHLLVLPARDGRQREPGRRGRQKRPSPHRSPSRPVCLVHCGKR